MSKRPYTVHAVIRMAAILKAFSSPNEILALRCVQGRTGMKKNTAFRMLETLVEAGLLERTERQGYRSRVKVVGSKQYRIGYASQSPLLPYTGIVTDSLVNSVAAANIDLLVLSNGFSSKTALENIERFVAEKVDLVIDSQIYLDVSAQIGGKLCDAKIPFIAVDIPHPGGTYFGVDNYDAGRLAGRHAGSWIVKNWEGRLKQILFLGSDAAGTFLNERLTGVSDVLGEHIPNVKSIRKTYYDTKGGRFDATLEIVRRHIRRCKTDGTLVVAVNDTVAVAALYAFREIGFEEGCAVIGHDGSVEVRHELRKPVTRLIGSVAFFPEDYGPQLIKLAMDILGNRPVPPAVFIRHKLVTTRNVDQVYPNDFWIKPLSRYA